MKPHTSPPGPGPARRPRYRCINLLTCAALLTAQLTLLPNSARADILVDAFESGGNVIFSFSGSVNTTGLATTPGTTTQGFLGVLYAGGSTMLFGGSPGNFDQYTIVGLPAFGSVVPALATAATGDRFGFDTIQIAVPQGYVSGTQISGSATFPGTFTSLNLDQGIYQTDPSPFFSLTLIIGGKKVKTHDEEISAQTTGLPMANATGPMLMGAAGTVTNDVNGFLFNLLAGDGEEAANDGSISASLDYGVIVGQGDGPEDPVAIKGKRSRQWEIFSTVGYGNVKLNAINGQAGVQVDSWAPSIGLSRHLSRGLALGFAVSFLTSDQRYTAGLGSLHLEGPALSAYVTFVRKNFWTSLLYNFGTYELDSRRNPGFGFAQAFGTTRTYTHAVQYNTGWNFRFQNNTLVTGPFAGIDYLHGSVDGYSETGGGLAALAYGTQTYQSLVTRVGWSASKKIQTDWALVTPQVRLSYERQNLKNNGTSVALINAPFTAAGGNQNPGQDYMVAGAGVNFEFNDQFSMLLNYQGQFFRQDMQAHYAQVRFGYKF